MRGKVVTFHGKNVISFVNLWILVRQTVQKYVNVLIVCVFLMLEMFFRSFSFSFLFESTVTHKALDKCNYLHCVLFCLVECVCVCVCVISIVLLVSVDDSNWRHAHNGGI